MTIVHPVASLASPAMQEIWEPKQKYALERQWWIWVMTEQRRFGVDIPAEAIEDYRQAAGPERVDLESIARRETVTRHDVKARLEEFNALAGGWQHAHKGMTGRDLDDNVEMIQAIRATRLLAQRLRPVNENAAEQLDRSGRHRELRGVWGPVGTGQDMTELLGGLDQLIWMNFRLSVWAGVNHFTPLPSYGQVYPRSVDYAMLSEVLSTVGFHVDRQWRTLIRGYCQMVSELAGNQWNEGDVSCSVVRRVALADAFLAADAGLSERLKGQNL